MSVPDYTLEDTLDFKFTTRQFSTGAPFASAGPLAVQIYEDNSITQITAGITVTAAFDGVTGLHNLRVAATAANGFENGKSYHCVVSVGTVDSVSVVGEVVQQFSIGRSAAAADLANATDGLGAIKADTAAVLTDTGTTLQAELDAIQAAVIDNAAGVDIAADIAAVKAETALIVADTNELQTDWADGGRLDLIVDAVLADTGELQTDWANGGRLDLLIDAILADTGELQTDWVNGGRLDLLLDSVITAVITNAAGVDIAADIAAVKAETATIVADTNELQTDDVPGLIAALNNVSTADVNAQVVDVLRTDTVAEPTGVPAATATLAEKIGFLYMVMRNRRTVTATKMTVYDDGNAAEFEYDLSDDGTTFDQSEANAI